MIELPIVQQKPIKLPFGKNHPNVLRAVVDCSLHKTMLLFVGFFLMFGTNTSTAQADSVLFERAVDYVIQHRLAKLTADNQDNIYGYGQLDSFQLETLGSSTCYRAYFIEYPTGINLSCLEGYYQTDWTTDFDGDGEQDVLIHITDQGLGGGGNVYGFDYHVVLMKNKKPVNHFLIPIGGGFSFGSLDFVQIKSGRIYTILKPRTVQNESETLNLVNQPKIFEYDKTAHAMVELSYSICPLSNLQFPLLKEQAATNRVQSQTLNYVHERSLEVAYTQKDASYVLNVTGCQSIQVYYKKSVLQKDKKLRPLGEEQAAALILQEIDFLRKNTTFASEIWEEVYQEATRNIHGVTEDESGYYSLQISLNNNRTASFIVNKVGSFTLLLESIDTRKNTAQNSALWEWEKYARMR